jgi:Ala-tRNA(Pro) deacylase
MYVVDFLRGRRVWYETLLHRPASSATKRAGSIHVSGRSVAKSVLVNAGGSLVLAVLPATSRIDLDRLGAVLKTRAGETRLASAEEIEGVFQDCEPGTIPPFGRLYGLRTVVDEQLAVAEVVTFTTNTRHIALRLRFQDYLGLEEPLCARFSQPIAPRAGRSTIQRRCAG